MLTNITWYVFNSGCFRRAVSPAFTFYFVTKTYCTEVDTVISCCFFPKAVVGSTTPKGGVCALYGSRRVFPHPCLSLPSHIKILITIFNGKENENNLISDEN